MTQKTLLNDTHRALGAKMVDFGGWDMPIHYGSQLDEHHLVRRESGVFDVSHMTVVDLRGDQVKPFLRRLLANSVDKLKVTGKALYSCMLNPRGGVIDDLIVYYLGEDFFRMVVNASTREKDLAWLREQAAPFGVTVEQRPDLAILAVQGPQARDSVVGLVGGSDRDALARLGRFAALQVTADDGVELFVARTGYTGEDGFEIVLPAAEAVQLWRDLAAQGVRPAGLGARDTLRLEAGMNLYGQDMDELTQPGEAALTWTVSLKNPERRFIGRDALEQFATPAAFVGLKLQERGVMRAHMAVRTKNGTGELTSGTMSPTLGVSIGFARLPQGVVAGDTVEVDIRGKWVPALVCKLPFVRNGKAVEHS